MKYDADDDGDGDHDGRDDDEVSCGGVGDRCSDVRWKARLQRKSDRGGDDEGRTAVDALIGNESGGQRQMRSDDVAARFIYNDTTCRYCQIYLNNI